MYDHGKRAFRKHVTNTVCDASGFKVKSNQTYLTWQGNRVIKEDWEPRDPQDFPPEIRKQKIYDNARPPKIEIVATPVIVPI